MQKDKKALRELDYLKKPSDWSWMSRDARRSWIIRALEQMKGCLVETETFNWVMEALAEINKEDGNEIL